MKRKAEPFTQTDLEALCKVLQDAASHAQLTGIMASLGLTEGDPGTVLAKWKRIFNVLAAKQNKTGTGNFALLLTQTLLSPKRFVNEPDQFEVLRERVNLQLAFHGWQLTSGAQFEAVQPVLTIDEARERANRLHAELERRKVHADVLAFCRPELLQENYFHAVFEATKSVADKIRSMAGVDGDGAEIVDMAFGLKNGRPKLAINSLESRTEQDEQRGFSNLVKGMFGMFRNVTGHAPKVRWEVGEQDCLDLLTLVSLIHRRLDASAITKGD